VVVTSVRVAASKDDSVPTEHITLNFAKLEFGYRPTKPDGSLGPETVFTWDVSAAKPF
jgi:hypothetical protein